MFIYVQHGNCDKNTLGRTRNDRQHVTDGDIVTMCDRKNIRKRWRREQHQQHYVENTTAEISVDLGVNCSISPEGTTSSSTKHLITNSDLREGLCLVYTLSFLDKCSPKRAQKVLSHLKSVTSVASEQDLFTWFSHKSRKYMRRDSGWHTPVWKTKSHHTN